MKILELLTKERQANVPEMIRITIKKFTPAFAEQILLYLQDIEDQSVF